MENEMKVLDVIIALAKAVKATKEPDEKNCQYYFDDGKNRLWGTNYLLGQILRQYRINDDHIFISVAADKLWKEITDEKEKIENYHYTMQVPVCCECTLDLYKGAAKKPFEKINLKPNGKFQYRQVFHDEHVIPIADIIEHLVSLTDFSYENVQKVLDNIYMCRMLKKENVDLTHKRPFSVVKTIEEVYNPKGIEILCWEERKNKL